MGHDAECLLEQCLTNLFTSDFSTKTVLSFLGLSAACSLGKSLPYTPEDTFDTFLDPLRTQTLYPAQEGGQES